MIIIIIICEWLDNSIWPIDATVTSTTNPGGIGPGNYGNEGEFRYSPGFRTAVWF